VEAELFLLWLQQVIKDYNFAILGLLEHKLAAIPGMSKESASRIVWKGTRNTATSGLAVLSITDIDRMWIQALDMIGHAKVCRLLPTARTAEASVLMPRIASWRGGPARPNMLLPEDEIP